MNTFAHVRPEVLINDDSKLRYIICITYIL